VSVTGPTSAPRVHLTEIGLDLWPVLLTLWWWEAEWASEHVEPFPRCPSRMRRAILAGAALRELSAAADLADVSGVFGPSGSFERSAPRATTRRRSSSVASAGPGLFPRPSRSSGTGGPPPRWPPPSSAAAASPTSCRRRSHHRPSSRTDSVSSAIWASSRPSPARAGRAGSSTASPRRPRVLPAHGDLTLLG